MKFNTKIRGGDNIKVKTKLLKWKLGNGYLDSNLIQRPNRDLSILQFPSICDCADSYKNALWTLHGCKRPSLRQFLSKKNPQKTVNTGRGCFSRGRILWRAKYLQEEGCSSGMLTVPLTSENHPTMATREGAQVQVSTAIINWTGNTC